MSSYKYFKRQTQKSLFIDLFKKIETQNMWFNS